MSPRNPSSLLGRSSKLKSSSMSLEKLLFNAVLVLAAAIDLAEGYATVSGTVYCDQCKDGHRSLFDYPIYGIKVRVACRDGDGKITMEREETTNWVGNFGMRFDGTPDLRGCFAQVSGNNGQSWPFNCGASAGPPQSLRLLFSVFDMEFYVVDSLLSQPAQPMPFCPFSSSSPFFTPNPFIPRTPANPQLPPFPWLPPPTTPQLPPFPWFTPPATPQLPPPATPQLPPFPPFPWFAPPATPQLPPLPPIPFLPPPTPQFSPFPSRPSPPNTQLPPLPPLPPFPWLPPPPNTQLPPLPPLPPFPWLPPPPTS